MMLYLLNRKEKLKFLDLTLHMILIDGEASILETKLLETLVHEVGDDITMEYTFSLSNTLEETLTFFEESTEPVKKIIFLNLFNITMYAEFYNTSEHFFLEKVRQTFEISNNKKQELMSLVFESRDLEEKISRTVKS